MHIETGLFFAPCDLPQLAMNVTTLLVPLFVMMEVARRVIAPGTPCVDLQYRQALSLVCQGGVVAWVAFWAIYGQGFAADNLAAIASFGLAYMAVVLIEPIADLAVLAGAKALKAPGSPLVAPRLYAA